MPVFAPTALRGAARAVARRRGWLPLSLLGGLVATGMLAAATTGALGAFAATLTNNGNSASTGSLTMQETNSSGTVTCRSTDGAGISVNSATCTGINHYGSTDVVPQTQANGSVTSATVVVKNTGTVRASGFTVSFGTCSQAANTAPGYRSGSSAALCDGLYVGVNETQGGATNTVVPVQTMTSLGRTGTFALAGVDPGETVRFSFVVGLTGDATNTFQGLTASHTITFQFTS